MWPSEGQGVHTADWLNNAASAAQRYHGDLRPYAIPQYHSAARAGLKLCGM